MDAVMREDLVAAGMDAKQAEVLVSHLPDWSQLATKADLKELAAQMATKADLKDLEQQFREQMLDLQRQMVDLQGQMVDMKSSLAWRLWVAVVVVAAVLPYLQLLPS